VKLKRVVIIELPNWNQSTLGIRAPATKIMIELPNMESIDTWYMSTSDRDYVTFVLEGA